MTTVERGRQLYAERHPRRTDQGNGQDGRREVQGSQAQDGTTGLRRGRELYNDRHPGRFQAAGTEPGTEVMFGDGIA